LSWHNYASSKPLYSSRWIASMMTEMNQREAPYLDALIKLQSDMERENRGQFFFPGHESGYSAPPSPLQDILRFDLPELEELDNIHAPQGPLKKALELTAALFGAQQSWFLVNGATSGVLISIISCVRWYMKTQRQKESQMSKKCVFLVPRDAHKSVHDALALCDELVETVPLSVVQDVSFDVSVGPTLSCLRGALEQHSSNCAGLLLTRPSYQGLLTKPSAFAEIVNLAHRNGVPVVVDEAHGSHLRFLTPNGELGALAAGADLVIQSAHKTLTGPSQCAILHLGPSAFTCSETKRLESDGNSRNRGVEKVHREIHAVFSQLTTTSPNSLLLAAIDATRRQFAAEVTQKQLLATSQRVSLLRSRIREHGGWTLLDDSHKLPNTLASMIDPLRVCVRPSAADADLVALDNLLFSEHKIVCELNLDKCLVFCVPPLRPEAVNKLESALLSVLPSTSQSLISNSSDNLSSDAGGDFDMTQENEFPYAIQTGDRYRERSEVEYNVNVCGGMGNVDRVPLMEIVGRVSAETVALYPPGIPLVLRGDKVTSRMLERLVEARTKVGGWTKLIGCADPNLDTLLCLRENI